MKLEGRKAVLVELSQSEYNALSKQSEEKKLSMTLIVRDLIKEHVMQEDLFGSLSKRMIKYSEESEEIQPIVVHLADEEYEFLKKYSDRKGVSMTIVVRNLVRKYIMGISPLD